MRTLRPRVPSASLLVLILSSMILALLCLPASQTVAVLLFLSLPISEVAVWLTVRISLARSAPGLPPQDGTIGAVSEHRHVNGLASGSLLLAMFTLAAWILGHWFVGRTQTALAYRLTLVALAPALLSVIVATAALHHIALEPQALRGRTLAKAALAVCTCIGLAALLMLSLLQR